MEKREIEIQFNSQEMEKKHCSNPFPNFEARIEKKSGKGEKIENSKERVPSFFS